MNNRKNSNIDGLSMFILLCALNSVKGVIGLSSSIGTLFTVLILIVCFIYFIRVHLSYKQDRYMKGVDLMIILVTIYGIISVIQGRNLLTAGGDKIISYKFLLQYYLSLLPFYVFYYFARNGIITDKLLKICFFLFFIISVVNFTNNYFRGTDLFGMEDVVNNISYSFVPLIPLLFLTNMKNNMKLYLMMTIALVVVFGMKRGAILITVILVIYFIRGLLVHQKKKNIAAIIVIVIAGVYYINKLYSENYFFQARVEETLEGNSSGRDVIYANYYNYYVNRTSQAEFLLGKGSFATVEVFGQYAHNDWLEIAIDMGLIGVICYLIYWLFFALEWRSFKDKETKMVFTSIMIIYFLESLFSMSISSMEITASLCLGYCLAHNDMAKNKSRIIAKIKLLERN